MTGKPRAWLIAVVAAALCSVAVLAQNSKGWDDPYEKGLKSFQAKKYQEAIAEFEEAVRTNSKAEAYKLIEGVHHTDYFPYYYLGIAYFETGDFVKAAANFQKAKSPAPSDKKLAATLADYMGRLPGSAPATNPQRPQQPAAPSAAFTNALNNAGTAFQGKHWQDALGAYDSAKSIDAAAYAQQNIQSKRDDAARAWASDLNNEGRGLLATSLSQAKTKFAQAEQLLPGSATDSLNLVKQRETDYQTAKAGIDPDITGKNFKAAKDKLDRAKAANPEQFTIDKLEARLTVVNAGLAAPVNPGTLNNAPSNMANPAAPGTPGTLDKSAKLPPSATAPDTTKDSLRTALLALANGDAQNSITILEPIQQQTASTATAAALHAYLGVAYATRAFSSAKSDEQSRLSGKALEQFKLALSSQHDFQLSTNIVSPKILQMFEQARR